MPTVACMPRRHALAVVPLVVLVAALVGCSGATRIPPPEPSSSIEPLFASDEEALEAATEAYEEYLVASNAVTASADLDVEPIEGLVTAEYLENEIPALDAFSEGGFRSSGETRLVSSELQQVFVDEDGRSTVVVYVCLDVSGIRLVDATGSDVTPEDRASFVGLEVELTTDEVPGGPGLLVNRSDQWTGSGICD